MKKESINMNEHQDIMLKMSYGLYIVTSFDKERLNGQIANVVFQITSERPCLVVGINKENLSHKLISNTGYMGVCILREDTPRDFIEHFGLHSGTTKNKLANLKYFTGETGCPLVLDHTIAALEVKIVDQHTFDTHTLFIGEVIHSHEFQEDGRPLTYNFYYEEKQQSRKNKESITPV